MVPMMKIFRLSYFLLFLGAASCTGTYLSAAPLASSRPGDVSVSESSGQPADNTCAYSAFLVGRTAELGGHLDAARAAYEQALICDPQAEHVMRNLAVLLVRMGQKPEAVLWLNEIRGRHPADTETLTFLATLFTALGQPAEAIELYQGVLQQDPKNFHASLLLGTLYVQTRQYDKAREVFEQLVQADPDSYIGHFYLAKLYQELHEFDKALASYGEAMARNWSDVLAFEVADLYEVLGRYQEAIAIYREILSRDETSERARGGLAGIHLQLGDLDQAMSELQKLRNYATDLQKVDFAIGRLLIQQERYDEAEQQFSQLLVAEPAHDGARYLLALIHYERKDFPAVEEMIRSIPAEAASYADATLLLVRMFEENGDTAEVENILVERLAREETRKAVFYVALATFYQEQEQPERGMAIYAAALERYPGDAQVLFRYGMFLERQGQPAMAMEQMQKVLDLEPGNPYALNYVGYTWADQGVNLEAALDYIMQAVALKPKDGFIRDSLGWVYFRLGKIDQALIELEQAITLEPEDPNIHEHLGDVYMQVEEHQQARQAYLRAMELYDQEEKQEEVKRKLEAMEL
jgi:tetratricopeptide (TPR) repeat protein